VKRHFSSASASGPVQVSDRAAKLAPLIEDTAESEKAFLLGLGVRPRFHHVL
jgi:hypothetical protein